MGKRLQGCCPWLEFISNVRERWQREWGALDSDHARVAWGRYAATPGEYLRAMSVGNGHVTNGRAGE
jgi:hypothetical protein